MSEPTQDRILAGALKLFSSKGYDATSVREICAEAGITKPTLYHFYGSKEGVYRVLVDGILDEFRTEMGRGLETPGSTRERLKRVARAYFVIANERRELVRLIMSLVYNISTAAPVTTFHEFYEEVVARIGQAVDGGVARGEIDPGLLEVRMLIFMGSLGEAMCGSLIADRPALTDDLADALVDAMIDGWAPRGGEP